MEWSSLGKDSGILHWVVSQGNLLQLISQLLSPGFPEYLEDFWWAMENLSWWCWGLVFPDKINACVWNLPQGTLHFLCLRTWKIWGSGWFWELGLYWFLWLPMSFMTFVHVLQQWLGGGPWKMYRVGGLNKVLFMRIVQVFGTSPQETLHVCFLGFPRYLEDVEGFRLSLLRSGCSCFPTMGRWGFGTGQI